MASETQNATGDGLADALGVESDVTAMEMNEDFRSALTVGRPICRDAVEVL